MAMCISCTAFAMAVLELHQRNTSIGIQIRSNPIDIYLQRYTAVWGEEVHLCNQHIFTGADWHVEWRGRMVIHSLAVIELHMKQASLRVHFGIHCSYILFMCIVYMGYNQGTSWCSQVEMTYAERKSVLSEDESSTELCSDNWFDAPSHRFSESDRVVVMITWLMIVILDLHLQEIKLNCVQFV
jgi:hypothetical protein